MKFAFLALVLSFSALAETTCFVRTVELNTKEVTMAQELCFGDVELNLDVFGTSKATIRFSNDGLRALKVVDLKNGTDLGNGSMAFNFVADSHTNGGFCSEMWQADAIATLVVKRDGTSAYVAAVNGEVSYSYDMCHSSMRTQQELSFEKR
ncbi:MAG: hypothetical protein K2P81_09845 [Bacteriovoracaceae bacterium]|nr:hypothetical protein [Bacteriovoracaceae bacterium]